VIVNLLAYLGMLGVLLGLGLLLRRATKHEMTDEQLRAWDERQRSDPIITTLLGPWGAGRPPAERTPHDRDE